MVIFRPAAFIAVNWGTVIARCSELMLNFFRLSGQPKPVLVGVVT